MTHAKFDLLPKNWPSQARAYKRSHRWLKKTKIAALAMITQRGQTYASHVDFDSFICFYLSTWPHFDPKNSKGKSSA